MGRIVKGDLEIDGTVYADTIQAKKYKNIPPPSINVATQLNTSPLTINTTTWPGVVIGTANITTKGNPVVIIMCIGITNTSGGKRTYTFRMLRDGTEVNISDRPTAEITAGETFQWDLCFVDEGAGAGPHVYTVEAISDSVNANQVSNHRRIIATAY